MHEMGLCQSALDIVLKAAAANGVRKVTGITIRAGEMRGIVQSQMDFCFEFLTKGTAAEGSKIRIETVPITCRCHDCAEEFPVVDFRFVCPKCAGGNLATLHGMELEVKEIEAE